MGAESALEVALRIATTFDELDIPYLVGGSLASSLHGEPRSTQDVDFVADLDDEVADAWLDLLGDEFYADRERVVRAIRSRGSFNVIHLGTMFKADVFVLAADRAGQLEMKRRERYELGDGRHLWVATAEDIVLQKLHWYRLGNEVSDRQWRDVVAVLKVREPDLDLAYLHGEAARWDLETLLERALEQAAR